MKTTDSGDAYWRANIGLVRLCLIIWAIVSFLLAIILRPSMMGFKVGGADLGFWFAQQGSIYIYLILIFFYAWRMNAIDREHGVEEE
jgi:putative solute:sodium symporter small subunit